MLMALTWTPKHGGYTWEPWLINTCTTLLFLLLVHLTARLAHTDRTGTGILLTAFFLLLFYPGVDNFFMRDEEGLLSLGSQCIVPFFIGQYNRLRRKDFTYWYVLMLLMGTFCSYTHNGVTLPLCAGFLWVSLRHLKGFFRMACWPMVIGFVLGTSLSLLTTSTPSPLHHPGESFPSTLQHIPLNTWHILCLLWDTKVFVAAVCTTAYLFHHRTGRRLLQRVARRNYPLTVCLVFSLVFMPLAPLGIDNAVHGVCFFCMFWMMFLARALAAHYFDKRI